MAHDDFDVLTGPSTPAAPAPAGPRPTDRHKG